MCDMGMPSLLYFVDEAANASNMRLRCCQEAKLGHADEDCGQQDHRQNRSTAHLKTVATSSQARNIYMKPLNGFSAHALHVDKILRSCRILKASRGLSCSGHCRRLHEIIHERFLEHSLAHEVHDEAHVLSCSGSAFVEQKQLLGPGHTGTG